MPGGSIGGSHSGHKSTDSLKFENGSNFESRGIIGVRLGQNGNADEDVFYQGSQ